MSKTDDFEREVQETTLPTEIDIFYIEKANITIAREMTKPDPRQLYKSLWYEGDCCSLFANTNLGKSILAVQIGEQIAKNITVGGKPAMVIYFDFELSDKQFQLRYTKRDEINGSTVVHSFPDNFHRATDNPNYIDTITDEMYLQGIEKVIQNTGAKIVIIDNLTWLCNESEKCGDATTLMKRLKALKIKYELSMLVIAHTPKRDSSKAITTNDLAGANRLISFFDSAFAIGQSAKDNNLRYIKQVKSRNGAKEYDADNVLICEIRKDLNDGFLYFEEVGSAAEIEHLKEPSDKDHEELKQQVRQLKAEGKSLREIAEQFGFSVGKVQSLLR